MPRNLKFLFFSILFLLILSACRSSAPASLSPTTPPKVDTATSIPTDTLGPTPTPNVVYDPAAQANRVSFAPYATWVQIGGLSAANSDVRYVLAAQQYQVMSVAILQGPPFSVEVVGADQQVLTDLKNPQAYWRGGLPSTQDYYVTVKAPVEAPFTLRIAINPPGLAFQYFEYVDPQFHALLDYSDMFTPTSWPLPFTTKGTPLLTLYFIEPSYYYPTTNLVEAALMLDATADPGAASTCTQPSTSLNEKIIGQVTVNGYTFTKSEFTGVAAGNEYDQIFYRTVTGGKCFEVIFLIHSGNIGNYPPGTVVEFDMQRLLHQFETVLATFNVK